MEKRITDTGREAMGIFMVLSGKKISRIGKEAGDWEFYMTLFYSSGRKFGYM